MNASSGPVLLLLAATLWAGCAGAGVTARRETPPTAKSGVIVAPAFETQASRDNAFHVATAPRSLGASGSERPRFATDLTLATHRDAVMEPPPFPQSKPLHLKPIRPAREAVWIDGYWAYTGNPDSPYEWMSGHWEIPPPGGRSWVPSAWQPAGNKFVYVRGHWR